MNIAYLILSHNNPEQLDRLYNRLNQDNADFYIHIDKKSSFAKEITDNFSKKNNVTVVSLFDVYWMGFNMVKSTTELLKLAYNSNKQYKYYALLSGQDYPIKSNLYINKFFADNSSDFIGYNKIDDLSKINKSFELKYKIYHYYDIPYTNPRDPKKIPFLVKSYFRLKKLQSLILPKRKFYKKQIPVFGPQWFALTGETVAYILEYINKNPSYSKFMKFTEGTDETFFHTIIFNSPRKTNLYKYENYLEWEKSSKQDQVFRNHGSCLHFMDWSDRGKNKPKPAILTLEYFPEIKESDLLFARKFDSKESLSLMDKIDIEILG